MQGAAMRTGGRSETLLLQPVHCGVAIVFQKNGCVFSLLLAFAVSCKQLRAASRWCQK